MQTPLTESSRQSLSLHASQSQPGLPQVNPQQAQEPAQQPTRDQANAARGR